MSLKATSSSQQPPPKRKRTDKAPKPTVPKPAAPPAVPPAVPGECSICLDPLESAPNGATSQCNGQVVSRCRFIVACLEAAVAIKAECPLCRTSASVSRAARRSLRQ